jgi:hypothetical protein
MTLDQGFAFAIILGTIGLLIWDRIRYDLVALLSLLAAIACGIVTPNDAFRGFSDDIVIIVGSALVVSAAIGRSGLVETLMKPLVPRIEDYITEACLPAASAYVGKTVRDLEALGDGNVTVAAVICRPSRCGTPRRAARSRRSTPQGRAGETSRTRPRAARCPRCACCGCTARAGSRRATDSTTDS